MNEFFKSERFINEYNYFYKKLHLIIPNLDNKFFNSFILIDDDLNIGNMLMNKIIIYNEKLNVNNIPVNEFGYNLVLKKYNNGVGEIEFENLVKNLY